MNEVTERLELAVRLAIEAGQHSLSYFKSRDLGIEFKEDKSPVTKADRESEDVLRKRIVANCPDDTIIGEEYQDKMGTSGFRWYLDPIDGTEAFIRGIPLFGTMIGIEQDNEPIVGVIFLPALQEIIFAAKNHGAKFGINIKDTSDLVNIYEAKVSQVPILSEATLASTDICDFQAINKLPNFLKVIENTKQYRGWSDCYGHYLVATGRIDAMIDPIMNVWDTAPLLPIIEEAGGIYSDIHGKVSIHSDSALSSNGLIHQALLNSLKS